MTDERTRAAIRALGQRIHNARRGLCPDFGDAADREAVGRLIEEWVRLDEYYRLTSPYRRTVAGMIPDLEHLRRALGGEIPPGFGTLAGDLGVVSDGDGLPPDKKLAARRIESAALETPFPDPTDAAG